jgi:hypothetical protein
MERIATTMVLLWFMLYRIKIHNIGCGIVEREGGCCGTPLEARTLRTGRGFVNGQGG